MKIQEGGIWLTHFYFQDFYCFYCFSISNCCELALREHSDFVAIAPIGEFYL